MKGILKKEIEFKPIAIKILMMIALAYLLFPQMLYMGIIMKPVLAVPLTALTALTLLFAWREIPLAKKSLCIPAYVVIGTEIVMTVIFLSSGMGGFMGGQMGDYARSNAILSDLVNSHWPVTYNQNHNISVLNYYVAYFVPGAAVGKVFGRDFHIAEIAVLLWTIAGFTLGFFLIFAVTGVCKLRTVWVFFCWAGLDWIGYSIVNGSLFYGTQHLEHWASIAKDYGNGHIANYMSIASGINWKVQSYVGVLIACFFILMMIRMGSYKLCVLLAGALLFWSPLVAVGVLPFAIVILIYEKGRVRKFLSIPDLLSIPCVALPAVLYFLSMNLKSAGGRESVFRGLDWLLQNWTIFILFVVLEFGLAGALIWMSLEKASLLDKALCLTALATMTLSLFVDYGLCHDFSMNATEFSWLILFSFAPAIFDTGNKALRKWFLIYMVGATITSATEYARMAQGVMVNRTNVARAETPNNTVTELNASQYVGSPNSFFFRKCCDVGEDMESYNEGLSESKDKYVLYRDDAWTIYFYEDMLYFYEARQDEAASVSITKSSAGNDSKADFLLKDISPKYGTLSEIAGLGWYKIGEYGWERLSITLTDKTGSSALEISLGEMTDWAEKNQWEHEFEKSTLTDGNWTYGILKDGSRVLCANMTISNFLLEGKSLCCSSGSSRIADVDCDGTYMHLYLETPIQVPASEDDEYWIE